MIASPSSRLRSVALIAALLGSAGCSGGTEPSGLVLRVALDRSSVVRSESVQLTLTLTNASIRTVRVLPADAYGLCSRAFEVFDSLGRPVAVPTALCAAISIVAPTPVDLRPGESMAITDWWRPSESWVDGQPLVPGTYRLRGVAAADDGVVRSPSREVRLLD